MLKRFAVMEKKIIFFPQHIHSYSVECIHAVLQKAKKKKQQTKNKIE